MTIDKQGFNSNSFFVGFITGLFIQWTNIVPVLGAFVLGLSIQNLPEAIDLRNIPTNFTNILSFIFAYKRKDPMHVSENNQTEPERKTFVHAIKKKDGAIAT